MKENRVENVKKYQIEYRNNKAKYLEYQKNYHLTYKNKNKKKEICEDEYILRNIL